MALRRTISSSLTRSGCSKRALSSCVSVARRAPVAGTESKTSVRRVVAVRSSPSSVRASCALRPRAQLVQVRALSSDVPPVGSHEPPVSLTKLIKREVEIVKDDMPAEVPPPPNDFKLADEPGSNYFILEKMGKGGEKIVIRCEFVPPPPEPYDVDAAFGEWAVSNPDQVRQMVEQNPVLPAGVKLETHRGLLANLGIDPDTVEESPEEGPSQGDMPGMDETRNAQFQVHITKTSEKDSPTMIFSISGAETGIEDIGSIAIVESGYPGIDKINASQDYEYSKRYLGPRFEDFDDDMKAAWSGYLMRRGVDNELATWLFNYAQYKESVEYMSFLNRAYKFLKS